MTKGTRKKLPCNPLRSIRDHSITEFDRDSKGESGTANFMASNEERGGNKSRGLIFDHITRGRTLESIATRSPQSWSLPTSHVYSPDSVYGVLNLCVAFAGYG